MNETFSGTSTELNCVVNISRVLVTPRGVAGTQDQGFEALQAPPMKRRARNCATCVGGDLTEASKQTYVCSSFQKLWYAKEMKSDAVA